VLVQWERVLLFSEIAASSRFGIVDRERRIPCVDGADLGRAGTEGAMGADLIGAEPSYYALRIHPQAVAPVWWAAARVASEVPAPVRALVAGRARVEVSAREAIEAIAWARELPGWRLDHPAPRTTRGMSKNVTMLPGLPRSSPYAICLIPGSSALTPLPDQPQP
jgi:hypothetical protein